MTCCGKPGRWIRGFLGITMLCVCHQINEPGIAGLSARVEYQYKEKLGSDPYFLGDLTPIFADPEVSQHRLSSRTA